MPIRHHTSKLYQIEKIVKEKFESINFQIIFLNVSSKGTFVNFVLKDKKNFDTDKAMLRETKLMELESLQHY